MMKNMFGIRYTARLQRAISGLHRYLGSALRLTLGFYTEGLRPSQFISHGYLGSSLPKFVARLYLRLLYRRLSAFFADNAFKSIAIGCLVFYSSIIFADLTPDDAVRRIDAHLILKDYVSALDEAEAAQQLYPESSEILEAIILVHTMKGDEKQMIAEWTNYTQKFPENQLNRNLIERMAWGVITKGSHSSCVVTRAISLMAAFFSQGSKGVNLLYEHLNDNSSLIRELTVKLSGHLRDEKLIEGIKRLLKEERVWNVRKEVIQAVGKMKIRSLENELESLIASNHSTAEEKALAIQSLVNIRDDMSREDIKRLLTSDRVGLRLLACKAVGHFNLTRDRDLIASLTKDFNAEVRMAALQTLGQLRPWEENRKIALEGIQDNNARVGVTAAWLLTLEDPEKGQKSFEKYLNHNNGDIRVFAAAALAKTGKYGVDLSRKQIRENQDTYVKLNVALGLIGQRTDLDICGDVINQALKNDHQRWCWQEKGLFRILTPHVAIKDEDSEDNTPESQDQLARLEILNILAMIKDRSAQDAIKRFLSERSWNVSGTASALLLTEGDDEAVDIVKNLIKDPNSRTRMRAALLLSLWSRDEAAIKVLQDSYRIADHEQKTNILEGLGRIGSNKSIPFLIDVLSEPSQTLRVIAAMALIQTLNH